MKSKYGKAVKWDDRLVLALETPTIVKNYIPFADRLTFSCKNRRIARHGTID
jgi:hypothetical protein